jgi:Tfp pilus assembly protein PilE
MKYQINDQLIEVLIALIIIVIISQLVQIALAVYKNHILRIGNALEQVKIDAINKQRVKTENKRRK